MSIYAYQENSTAATATTADGSDFMPITTSTGLQKIAPYALLAGNVVDTTATTLTITQKLHGNRVVTLSSAAPLAVTLPQATGTGSKYTFQVQVAATGTAHTIKVANSTDVMQGVSWCLTTSAANVVGYGTSATSDTISLNGTTLGGVVGDIIEIQDVKTGFFAVKIFASPTGTTATPFSATV